MLIGGFVGVAVFVLVVAAAVALRRRSHDDEHSVRHYHRQLHTLGEMRAPDGAPTEGDQAARPVAGGRFPVSAVRVSGSSTVRLTEAGHQAVPPLPPPVPNSSELVTFDDAGPGPGPEPIPRSFMTGTEDRAMHAINHRPRRLGGQLAALASVAVLIAVLIVTGFHASAPAHKTRGSTMTTAPSARGHAGTEPPTRKGHGAATPATTPPLVSAPGDVSAHAATYQVASPTYALEVAATSGPCWVQVTDTATGAVPLSATLPAGQRDSVAATGSFTVVAGAPAAFAVAIDGTLVALPPGALAPFTLTFEPAQAG